MTRQQTARIPATIRISVTLSIVHLVLFENHNLALHKVCEEIPEGNDGWPDDHNPHGRKNAKNQGRYQLDGCFGGPFLGLLPALRSQGIGECAQRLRDGRSEAIRLNKHGYERARTLEVRPYGKRLPCGITLHPCPLFKVDEQQFFT